MQCNFVRFCGPHKKQRSQKYFSSENYRLKTSEINGYRLNICLHQTLLKCILIANLNTNRFEAIRNEFHSLLFCFILHFINRFITSSNESKTIED